jgi:ribosomal protein S27AE
MTSSLKTSRALASKKAACPRCTASLTVFGSEPPYIDECGFESYRLKCGACGSALVGIIDPTDDKLLVTIMFQ